MSLPSLDDIYGRIDEMANIINLALPSNNVKINELKELVSVYLARNTQFHNLDRIKVALQNLDTQTAVMGIIDNRINKSDLKYKVATQVYLQLTGMISPHKDASEVENNPKKRGFFSTLKKLLKGT